MKRIYFTYAKDVIIKGLEILITERENELLRTCPELYDKALRDYINGERPRFKKGSEAKSEVNYYD